MALVVMGVVVVVADTFCIRAYTHTHNSTATISLQHSAL